MANYDGLSRNEWPSTWSPSADHPIVLDTEARGGLRYVSGDSGDQFSDITGQRLQDGMLVYLRDSYGDFEGGRYYQYNTTATRNVNDGTLPNTDSNWTLFNPLGTNVTFNDVTLTGQLNGPNTFYIDPLPLNTDSDGTDSDGKDKGLVVILGNLEVRGTQTTVNSYTLSISDKNIVLADSARDSADADGGGITLNGANATLLYDDSTDTWNFNKALGPTKIRGHLLPAADSTYNLGSDSNRWKDLYLSGQTINLGGLLIKNKDGVLFVEDSAGNPSDINVGNANIDSSITFVDDSGNSIILSMDDSGSLSVNGISLLNKSSSIGDLSDVDISTNLDSGALLVWDSATQSFNSTRTIPTEITFTTGIATEQIVFADSVSRISNITTFRDPPTGIHTTFLNTFDSANGFAVKSNNILFLGMDNQRYLRTYDSGHIELYYNGVHKLETRGYGVLVHGQVRGDSAEFTGNLTAETLTGEYVGFDSDLADSDARQTIRSYFSATGGLGYDSATGVFTFNVESAYTKAAFDSDWNVALDEAAIGGVGLTFNADSNTLSIDSAELSYFKSPIRSFFGVDGGLSYDSINGVFSFNVESAYTKQMFDSDWNVALDEAAIGGTGLTFNADSNTLSIDSAELSYFKAPIRSFFGVDGGLAYDSINGVFSFNVESAYTKVMFDSDWNQALDEAAIGGFGLVFNADSNRLSIDSAELYAYYSTDNLSEGDSNLYYTTARVDSAFDVRFLTKTTDSLSEGDNLYYTTARADSAFDIRFLTKTTDSLAEGDNLYYTTARADSAFDIKFLTKTTDSLSEGPLNLYYTTARADSAFDVKFLTKTTDSLAEGDNLYYTTARADSAFDVKFLTKTTDSLGEGTTNLYYTTSRFDSDFNSRFDSDFNLKLDQAGLAGINLVYDSATNSINMAASGVTSGVYGSATLIPVLTVDSYGTIDSAGTIAVGSIDSIQFNDVTNLLTIFTTSEDSFSTTIPSNGISVKETLRYDSVQENFSGITSIRFDNYTGFNVDSFGPNEVKVSLGSGFKTFKVSGDSDLVAVGEDTLEWVAGHNINLSTDASASPDKTLTINVDSDATFNSVTNTSGKTVTSPTITSVSDGTVTVVDTEPHNSGFTSIEYAVHMHDSVGGYSQLSKVLLTYNTTSVFFTEYGMVSSFTGDSDIGTLTADVNGGDIRLKFQRATGIGTVKVKPVKTVIT
jgi:hypothetical protein